MNQSPQAKTSKQEEAVIKFSSNLQKGDLALNQVIMYGWILYGQTRTGKTAAGHFLSGNPFRVVKIGGQDMIEITTCRNKNAKIGNSMNSQTQIPNTFLVQLKNPKYANQKCYVIDTPGYGDTYGVLRILSNGYYHYRLYSKVKNMKFILSFDMAHIKNTGKQFIDTIDKFTKSFQNYLGRKQQIWKSACFLFTKVDQAEYNLENIKQRLKSIIAQLTTQLESDAEEAIKKFVKFIIDDDRIFFIKKFRKGESADNRDLLEKIDQKVSTWWTRELIKDKPNQVDMKGVSFSLANDINISTTTTPKSKKQFAHLINFYNNKIDQLLSGITNKANTFSFLTVLNQLVNDAMTAHNSHKFLDSMKIPIQRYYSKYDQQYKEERQKRQKQLFESINLSVSESISKESKMSKVKSKNYIVKKHKALANIQNLKNKLNGESSQDKSIEKLQQYQQIMYKIVKQFNAISYKRNNLSQIIYKYGYIIHRTIEQVKLFLLLTNSASPELIAKIKQAANNKILLIHKPLQDFMGLSYSFEGIEYNDYKELHSQFVKRFDLNSQQNKGLIINQSLINLLSTFQTKDDMSLKIIKMILAYSNQILNDSSRVISVNDKHKLIRRLTLARGSCLTLYKTAADGQQIKKQYLILVRNITKNLGRLLQDMKMYAEARQVYKSSRYVTSVCKIYQTQIEGFKQGEINLPNNEIKRKQQQYKIRAQYIKYLQDHNRLLDALKVAQQTFELLQNADDLDQLRKQMTEIMLKMKSNPDQTQYEIQIFNSQLVQKLPEELETLLCKQVQTVRQQIQEPYQEQTQTFQQMASS